MTVLLPCMKLDIFLPKNLDSRLFLLFIAVTFNLAYTPEEKPRTVFVQTILSSVVLQYIQSLLLLYASLILHDSKLPRCHDNKNK